jgi:hypothetical protein
VPREFASESRDFRRRPRVPPGRIYRASLTGRRAGPPTRAADRPRHLEPAVAGPPARTAWRPDTRRGAGAAARAGRARASPIRSAPKFSASMRNSPARRPKRTSDSTGTSPNSGRARPSDPPRGQSAAPSPRPGQRRRNRGRPCAAAGSGGRRPCGLAPALPRHHGRAAGRAAQVAGRLGCDHHQDSLRHRGLLLARRAQLR